MENDLREKKQIVRLTAAVSMLAFAALLFWVINTIHYSHHDSIPSSILHTTPVVFVTDLHEIFGPLGAAAILTSDLIVVVWVALIAASLYVSTYVMGKNNQNRGMAKRLLVVTIISISILAFDLTLYSVEKHKERREAQTTSLNEKQNNE